MRVPRENFPQSCDCLAKPEQGCVRMHSKMTLAYKFASSVLVAALMFTGTDAFALTMGRARSVALLGQPLELDIPVQFDADESSKVLCFEADVFYGDVKLDASQVVVNSRMVGTPNTASVRIVGNAHVNEPIVTVYLRGGCFGKTTRKYVLLADVASEVTVGTSPAASLQFRPTPVASAPAPAAIKVPGLANFTPQAQDAGSRPNAKQGETDSQLASKDGLKAKRQLRTPPRNSENRPRLKLAPLDLSVSRDPTLKFSTELLMAPVDDPKKRSDAMLLWRLLNLSTEDLARDGARPCLVCQGCFDAAGSGYRRRSRRRAFQP